MGYGKAAPIARRGACLGQKARRPCEGARCATTTYHKTPQNQLEAERPRSAEPVREVSAHVPHEPIHRLDAGDTADKKGMPAGMNCLGGSVRAERVRCELLRLFVGHADCRQSMSQVRHIGVVPNWKIEVDSSRGVDVGHDVTATKHALPKEECIEDSVRTVVRTRYIDPLATINISLVFRDIDASVNVVNLKAVVVVAHVRATCQRNVP